MADRIVDIARALHESRLTASSIRPVTASEPTLSVGDAYAIQMENVARRVEGGARVAGFKVGLTSAAMQRQLGVAEPDFGHLLAETFHEDGAPVSLDDLIAPKIEPEIAFILRRPLAGPGLTMADVVRSIEYIVPSLEIIDSRIADWQITLVDTIADNASSAGVVLSPNASAYPDRPQALDAIPCVLTRNGRLVETGSTAAVMGHPLRALLWLGNRLGDLGTSIAEGNVVLPGSCTAAVDVSPGDFFQADFGSLGTVSTSFSTEVAS